MRYYSRLFFPSESFDYQNDDYGVLNRFLDYLRLPDLKMRLITLFIISSFAVDVWADSPVVPGQCKVNTPHIATENLPQLTIANDLVQVSADHAIIEYPSLLNYTGNVNFQQNDKFIRANKAQYNQVENIFSASGNLHFQDKRLTLTSDSLITTLDGKNTELKNSQYWFNNSMIHGSSDSFRVDDGRYLVLANAIFTTCPGETPDWALRAKEIKIDTDEAWATITRATLEIFEIPVFYFPYLTLPISDKRSSGFLYPSIGSNTNNGLEISAPFYWNIATNYDMTITPRLMTERGLQFNTEFRYLDNGQNGLFNFEYLSDDHSYDDSRYLFYWQHIGQIDDNWRLSTNFTHVSDDNYFNDVGSKYGNKTDNQLVKNIDLAYYSEDWWLNMRVQDIQVLGQQSKPYQLLPQISFHSYNNSLSNTLEYDVFSEFSYLNKADNDVKKTSRLHFEPTIRFPLNYASGNLTTEVKLMQTWYQQDDGINSESISRTLPQFRIHADVKLERELKFTPGYTQTLTPQIQYLFVPYEDQESIGLYDTALLRDDYPGLFRSRRFSGLDRIIDTNQITLGMTTIVKDEKNQPRLKASIGQTFYLKTSEMTKQGAGVDQIFPDRSALAGELSYSLNNRWAFSHAMQLNEQQSSITQSKSTLDYRLHDSKLVQLSHRYVKDISHDKINQLGFQAIWPINNEWTFVGNYYRDINLNRTIETFTGLQYESCCWSIRVQVYRQIQAQYIEGINNSVLSNEQFDTGVSFNFQIKGLGSEKSTDASEMLSGGLFSYRRPYYLKN